MSKTKTFLTDIRAKDRPELERQIAQRYSALRTLRFSLGFGTVSAQTELRRTRRELAQLWTVLGEKLLDADSAVKEK
ncbi:50S ribosomal protein L29 [Candidatus Berkelbacteria bacterium]|nr:50S ribosomal protein L29 [Candidatus Berkelbacteria bacterium]